VIVRRPGSPALSLRWHRGRLYHQHQLDRMIERANAAGARAHGTATEGGLTFHREITERDRREALRRIEQAYDEWRRAGHPPVRRVVP
jgi:hypothetical protein